MKDSPFYGRHVTSEAQTTTQVPQADDTLGMHVYRPKRTTCLRCGDTFDSYDPRYNRRCAACTKSVQSKDRYHY